MKPKFLSSLALGSLLAWSQTLPAQVVPDVSSAVQNAVDSKVENAVQSKVESTVENTVENTVEGAIGNAVERQVEQAQNAALERAVEQAQSAAGDRALEAAQTVQAEVIQSQTVEQIQGQVERAQTQAAEQAQAQLERVTTQVELAQGAVERAQDQVEQVQSQLERIPDQAVDRLQQRVPDIAPGLAGQIGADVADVVDDAAASAVAAAVPDDAPAAVPDTAQADTPTRQTVTTTDGTAAFVEITLSPGERAVEFEWVMVVTPEERARLDDEAADLLNYLTDSEPFALADGELLTFTVPPDLDANDAILDLVPDNMRDLIDRNHIYDTQDDDTSSSAQDGGELDGAQLSLPMPAVCAEPVALGMIDSQIDLQHPAFAASAGSIHQRAFVDAALAQPASHGTAIAGLLVGRDKSEQSGAVLHPLLPAATLYSASVFHEQQGAEQGATVMRILTALDWLLEQDDVRVVNMSLAGPPNRLLARAIAAATAQGKVIVAAAGNDGPYGPVRYPVAYDEAIGVTAVARDMGVFRFANQGPHIDYAALGVEVPTALQGRGFGPESGTSLAAPIISAFIACELQQHGELAQALAALDARVRDLGAPGADPVYGRGLLHP
jgi:subtilisin family serine protease